MALIKSLQTFCQQYGFNQTYWVAYSGGLDSHVLLHLLATLRQSYPLKLGAIHVNHGLSPHALAWVTHCAKVCKTLEIDFIERHLSLSLGQGKSLEEEARRERYRLLAEPLTKGDFLLTSHHQDDQAETLLLQMLRGSGPKGLAAMPHQKSLGVGLHFRPLLQATRADLENYAREQGLHWIEDESNTNPAFSRNFIRNHILPTLKTHWPSAHKTLARVASHAAEVQSLLEEMAAADLVAVMGVTPNILTISNLGLLSPARQRQLLRYWLQQNGLPLPSAVKIQQIQQEVLLARPDRMPVVKWTGGEVRRFGDSLYLMFPLKAVDKKKTYLWNLAHPLQLPHGMLETRLVASQGLRTDIKEVTVRFRQGGETCRLPGRQGHHQLKKLFQEWQVPPWERERIPLIYIGEKLAAIPPYFIHEDFCAKAEEQGYLIHY